MRERRAGPRRERDLRLYRLLSRLPVTRGYARKIFAVCFVGTHLPLIAFIVYLLSAAPLEGDPLAPVAILLAATLAGTALAFMGLAGC